MNNAVKKESFLHRHDSWFHRVFISEAILSLLLALSFVGVAYTDVAGIRSMDYWLWMIPLFAIASIVLEWSRYKQGKIDGLQFIRQQVLHWIAVYIAIKMIFILLNIGRLPSNATAFVLMTIMSLSTFLAGIYTGWRFIILGLFIALATILAAYLEAYVWILIPIAVSIILLGLFIGWREFKALSKNKRTHVT